MITRSLAMLAALLLAILPASVAAHHTDYLQCVPFARDATGIRIFGDAHTWWEKAKGRYGRGFKPRPGAIMAMRPAGNSRLGHVAAVSKIIDERTVLISHANWSGPGVIERNVKAVDVSPAGDWSKVRVWHGPSGKLGQRHWPTFGFIYKDGKGADDLAPSRRTSSRSRDIVADIIAGRYP